LFVPPTFAEAINQVVHAVSHSTTFGLVLNMQQQYKAAQQMLEELWSRRFNVPYHGLAHNSAFLFKDPPRVIVALSRDPKNVICISPDAIS
jgi:hypothetical protein